MKQRTTQKVLLTYYWYFSTADEWITLIASFASAHWHMIDDVALCKWTAHTWTWISAMLSYTCHSTGTIWVENTLWPTSSSVSISNIWWNAATFGNTIVRSTYWIFTTWRWIAWINRISFDWNWWASGECITSKSWQTVTECRMCHNMTLSVYSASIRAWIFATFSDASLIMWAIVMQHTLRSTIWRASNVIFYTWANWMALFYLTNREWTAWWRWT